jgi:hypothetical protein
LELNSVKTCIQSNKQITTQPLATPHARTNNKNTSQKQVNRQNNLEIHIKSESRYTKRNQQLETEHVAVAKSAEKIVCVHALKLQQ